MTTERETNRFAAVANNRSAPAQTSGSSRETMRKYTILLTESVAVTLDDDVTRLRRQLGRRIDKSAVIRQLVTLLHDDPALFERVAQHLPS